MTPPKKVGMIIRNFKFTPVLAKRIYQKNNNNNNTQTNSVSILHVAHRMHYTELLPWSEN